MSIEQLIPSLGKELNKLRARLAHVEELLGVGVSVKKSSNVDRSCLICGITWQMGVTSVPQHMVGRRHRANMEKLSKFPPPPFKAPTPSFKLPPPPFKAPTPSSKISPLSSLNVHSSSFMPDATSSQSTVCTSVELSTKSKAPPHSPPSHICSVVGCCFPPGPRLLLHHLPSPSSHLSST